MTGSGIKRTEQHRNKRHSKWFRFVALMGVMSLIAACGASNGGDATTTSSQPSDTSTSAPSGRSTTADPGSDFEGLYSNGDTIVIIVPYSPGGGFDVLARLVAPAMQDQIRDMTGASV